MKKLILLAALLAPIAAQADDFCMDLSGGARAAMHVRQIGLDARTQHEIADQTMMGETLTIMHRIIDDAYTQPIVSGATQKADAEQNFAVYWLLKCMKARNGFY